MCERKAWGQGNARHRTRGFEDGRMAPVVKLARFNCTIAIKPCSKLLSVGDEMMTPR